MKTAIMVKNINKKALFLSVSQDETETYTDKAAITRYKYSNKIYNLFPI